MPKRSILVLEDEPIIEEYLKNNLKTIPLSKINFADSIASAHNAIEDAPPNNILINLKLSDGWLSKKQIDFFLMDQRWQTVLITGARPCDILKDTSMNSLENIKILPKPFNSFQLLRIMKGLMSV